MFYTELLARKGQILLKRTMYLKILILFRNSKFSFFKISLYVCLISIFCSIATFSQSFCCVHFLSSLMYLLICKYDLFKLKKVGIHKINPGFVHFQHC